MDMMGTATLSAILLVLLWLAAKPLGRSIDRSIDRNLPDPSWFEA